jgi:hypothetical protein
VAVAAAAAAYRAARAAATAAGRAAAAAARAGHAAARAHRAAADAARDRAKAGPARRAAEEASAIAVQAREFADKAEYAAKAIEAGRTAITAALSAAEHAKRAAAANDDAVRHARNAGADASAAVAAAARARAQAERAVRAARAAEKYLQVAIREAFAARDAARRAADNAEAAARAAIEAAEHAGEAATAARRATENAEAATVAAQAAVDAATRALDVFEEARKADDERLAVALEEGMEAARAANELYLKQQNAADWDVEQAAQRDAETNRLIAEAQNPATPRPAAVAAARRAALNLGATAKGAWTQQTAVTALGGDEDEVLSFIRTGLAAAAAEDDRQAVMDLSITDNTALADAAKAALAGTDADVGQFLRTQDYPGRLTDDRVKVNQVLASARANGDVVLAQKAQEALDAGTVQALRVFLETGQYTAAAHGERVLVLQILNHPDSGPELKVAAQIALDGPPPALREFLDTGRHAAAERDDDNAAHVAVMGGLLERINQVAETAVTNAMEAQVVAAQARGDAERAAHYANQAAQSAQKAAGYASRAVTYANQAARAVDRAAAAVKTARNAATRANASARNAVRSAAWAISSYNAANAYAKEANVAARRARDDAKAAGADARAAEAAAIRAREAYVDALRPKLGACHAEYSSGPSRALERFLEDSENQWYRNCVRNILPDAKELAKRAYINSSFCSIYPQGSKLYQNCIHSVLDPDFRGMHSLTLLTELINDLNLMLVAFGAGLGALCVATVVCGLVAGTLLTMGDVGLNLYKFIKGDQSLADTLLKLGKTALESLVLAGLGKLVKAGFRAVKALYVATRNAKIAETSLQLSNLARLARLEFTCGLRGKSVDALRPVRVQGGCTKLIPLGGGWWQSTAGLKYGLGSKHGHRAAHLWAHLFPDTSKPVHTVFALRPGETFFGLIDEAWTSSRRNYVKPGNSPNSKVWVTDMQRPIGTHGERYICLIIKNEVEVITAWPRKDPNC